MATYLSDDGIVLRVHDFSETSQIVGVFTRDHGLVPLIAKGSKRTSKKNTMSGPLDLLTSGEVVFIPAKEGSSGNGGGSQLGTLAAWELDDHRQALRSSLHGLNSALMCAEVTTHLLQPNDPHTALFSELEAALTLLAHAPLRTRALVAYMKAALAEAGYWPQFAKCLACNRPVLDAPVTFSARAGGILCTTVDGGCRVDNPGPTTTIPGRIALALDRLPVPTALRAFPPERPADDTALKTALNILLSQIEAVTEKGLRTRYLLNSLFPTPVV